MRVNICCQAISNSGSVFSRMLMCPDDSAAALVVNEHWNPAFRPSTLLFAEAQIQFRRDLCRNRRLSGTVEIARRGESTATEFWNLIMFGDPKVWPLDDYADVNVLLKYRLPLVSSEATDRLNLTHTTIDHMAWPIGDCQGADTSWNREALHMIEV